MSLDLLWHDSVLMQWRDEQGWHYPWGLFYNPLINWDGHPGGDYERAWEWA